MRWGLSFGLLSIGLALGLYHDQGALSEPVVAIRPPVPGLPRAEDLVAMKPAPRPVQGFLSTTLAASTPLVQVAEAPTGQVVYPVAPNDSIRGKVRLEIIVATNGVVKQIRALSGKRPLAEAAAQAVHLWRYSSFPGGVPSTERETSVTVSFNGADAVSLEFPTENSRDHAN